MRMIRAHLRDLTALAVLVVAALVTAGYILLHQPAFGLQHSYYPVNAVFADAAAVQAGQGQAVTVAGVQVGEVGGVTLAHGRAIVRMEIFKRYAPIYRNATVLLEDRTPLKDMYLALYPGTPSAGVIPPGGTLGLAGTQPDVDVDQILSSLDADTRSYLLLLLSGGAEMFNGRGASNDRPSPASAAALAALLKRFGPTDRDALSFTGALAHRSDDLRRAIHSLDEVAGALASVDTQLSALVRHSSTDFTAIASQDRALASGVTLLPGTLRQTDTTLTAVKRFAGTSGPALQALEPFAKELPQTLDAVRSLANGTTAAIRTKLRPFASNPGIRRLASLLAPAASDLAKAAPALSGSIQMLNTLLNTLAYQQPGGEPSYLFWGAWLAHNLDSLTSLQDADGAIVQGQFLASCPSLQLLQAGLVPSTPSLAPIIDLLGAPSYASISRCYSRTATR